MDQIQDQLDQEIAQEVIALLNKKIANLRNENAQLQNKLSRSSVKTEDEEHGYPDDRTQHLLEEIKHWKSELERRPDPEEVSGLEEKLRKRKRRGRELQQNLRSQVEELRGELEESQSARQREQAVKEALEEEIQKLRQDLNQITGEKRDALVRLESQQSENFDVRQFLSSTLEESPPMPNPIVVTMEGEPRFKGVVIKKISGKDILSVNGVNSIKWANQGRRCLIPLPPVICSGKNLVAEKPRKETIEKASYELFVVGGRCIYYGTHRCIKVATMDWTEVTSLGQEFTDAFLESTVVQDGHAAPAIHSLMKNMYETGILKAGCAVLRCEEFDQAIARGVRSESMPPRIRSILQHLIHSCGKRRLENDGHSGEGSQGASKKPKIGKKHMDARKKRPAVHKSGSRSR